MTFVIYNRIVTFFTFCRNTEVRYLHQLNATSCAACVSTVICKSSSRLNESPFIVQGEGRGHLTQAITMEELLRRNGHEVVEVLVGKSNSRCLPGFFNRSIQAPVKRFLSPNFLPTPANKRASLARSVAYNLTRLPVYLKACTIYTAALRRVAPNWSSTSTNCSRG